MEIDNLVQQVKRGVDRGVQQVKKTAETVEAEARIFSLHRKVGLRVYQLWRAGQLSHPDLEEDLQQISQLEARVDAEPAEETLDATQVSPGARTCKGCGKPAMAGARFCTYCGQPQ